jgi:hypothetical protein
MSFAIGDTGLRQIIGGHFHSDGISCGDADVTHTHLTAQFSHDFKAILQFDAEGHAW